jgi:hypothetical protein
VKAFNHIYASELTTDGQPSGAPNRRALVIAGDDLDAKATVARLLDEFGFDTVPLASSPRRQLSAGVCVWFSVVSNAPGKMTACTSAAPQRVRERSKCA